MTDGLHRDVGAYVMGALDADEREAFEAHLAGCERCQADVVAFAPVPGLLARVDIAELEEARPSDPTPVLEAARAHVGGLARSRRRWQLAATGLAAAAVVLAVALFVSSDDTGPILDPVEPVELVLASNDSVSGRVALIERGWGATVEIDLLGLPLDDGYEIWAVGVDGTWQLAASFGPTDDGTCRVWGATSMHTADIQQIVVTTSDRAHELLWAWEE